MENIVRKLKPAQHEVQRAAHDQDLPEVARRARLDRVAEHRTISHSYQQGLAKTEVTV